MVSVGRNGENPQELRLALAMRGGASMAVWIGGAVAEVNHLRLALASAAADPDDSPRDEHPWSVLAGLAGYDSVVVDVLAGTSAGGLNATLLSSSLVYGLTFDRMRGVWIRLADLEAMARPVPKFWERPPQSLLEGDEYFETELTSVLGEAGTRSDERRALAKRTDLLLTATLLDPVVDRHFDGRSMPMSQEQHAAMFRFRHYGQAGDPLSDFGASDEMATTAHQLAHAARTTSSFPFAFEPATVHSTPDECPPGRPNMFGLFSESNNPGDPRPYRALDGGVLDNIPVTAAIRAIADAPANRPTQRWLLYLNPEPIVPSERRERSRRAVRVVSSALYTRWSQESLLADIEVLDEHNRSVARSALRRRSLFAQLRSTPPIDRGRVLTARAAAIRVDNAAVRAELDAQAVHRLLTEPTGTEDGRLVPPVVGDPLAGWSAPARTRLAERLAVVLADSAAPDRVFSDVRALLSAIEECIHWTRDIESTAESVKEIGGGKATLYRLRAFAEVVEGQADRYWTNGARLEPIVELGELDGWVERVVGRRERLQHRLPSPVEPLLSAVLEGAAEPEDVLGPLFQRALADLAAELESIVDSSGADATVDDGAEADAGNAGDGNADDGNADGGDGYIDMIARARAVLHQVMADLVAVAPDRIRVDEAEQVAYSMLEHAGDAERPDMLRDLVVLTAPLDVGRTPGSTIQFLRVVGSAPSSLPFDALRRPGQHQLRLADKIRGSDLGNFGAFLSAKWRANDWMWGRMDAATSLVRLLCDPVRLIRHADEQGAEGIFNTVRVLATRATPAELGKLDQRQAAQWRAFLTEHWVRRADQVWAELTALFAEPDDEHELTATVHTITERLHWTIAARELPFVELVNTGADPGSEPVPTMPEPEQLRRDVQGYDVGAQRFDDLDERRRASAVTRLGLIAYRTVLPGGDGALATLGRIGLTIAKPLVMAVLFALAAPVRAAVVTFLATTSVALTSVSESVPSDWPVHGILGGLLTSDSPREPLTPDQGGLFGFIGACGGWAAAIGTLFAVLSAAWLAFRLATRWSEPLRSSRWAVGIGAGVGLLAVLGGLFGSGFVFGPVSLGIAALVVTWLAAFACTTLGRSAAVGVTAAGFALTMWAFGPTGLFGAGWVVSALLVTAYGHMLLLSSVDVLAPRPRPGFRTRDHAVPE